MKWVKYLWILAGALLVGYVWQNHTLQQYSSQLSKVQSDTDDLKDRLKVQQQNQDNSPDVKASKDESFNKANDDVKGIMQSVISTDPRQFDTTLSGKVSPSTLSTLKSELTPTVTTGQFDSQHMVYSGVINKYDDPLNFLVVAKNNNQQNIYYVTYDLSNHEITDVDRAAMKGAFNDFN